MKTTTTKLMILSLLISASTSMAQVATYASLTKINSRVVSFKDGESSEQIAEKVVESKETKTRSAYMASEQFVFDNLATLKKLYSVTDIYYDLDQSAIRSDAMPVLDRLANLMKEDAVISVAITAYCDSRMSTYNNSLAVLRVKSAKAYLISKGIDADRIVLEKFGRPIVKNPCTGNPGCSLAEQQMNRKAEFNIILNGQNLAHLSSYND